MYQARERVSVSGTVGRAIASNIRVVLFETSHRQFVFTLFDCIEKEAGGGHFWMRVGFSMGISRPLLVFCWFFFKKKTQFFIVHWKVKINKDGWPKQLYYYFKSNTIEMRYIKIDRKMGEHCCLCEGSFVEPRVSNENHYLLSWDPSLYVTQENLPKNNLSLLSSTLWWMINWLETNPIFSTFSTNNEKSFI